MRYPGRALRCLGSEVRASDLLADNWTYAYLNIEPTGKQVQLFPLFIHTLCVSWDQSWVASGSFGRTIKHWDLSCASQAATVPPLMSFTPPESSGTKLSIYALAVDP